MEIQPIKTGTTQTIFRSGGVSTFSSFKIKTDGSYQWQDLFRLPKANETASNPSQQILRNAVGDRANYLYDKAKSTTSLSKLDSYITEINGLYDALKDVQDNHAEYLTVEDNQRIDQIGQYANLMSKIIPNSAPKTEDHVEAFVPTSTQGIELENELNIQQTFIAFSSGKPLIRDEFKEAMNQLNEKIQVAADINSRENVQDLCKTFMSQAQLFIDSIGNLTLSDTDDAVLRIIEDTMDIYEPIANADDLNAPAVDEAFENLSVNATEETDVVEDEESISGQGEEAPISDEAEGLYIDFTDPSYQDIFIDHAKQALTFQNSQQLIPMLRDLNALKTVLQDTAYSPNATQSDQVKYNDFMATVYTPSLDLVRAEVTTPQPATFGQGAKRTISFGGQTYTELATVGAGATAQVLSVVGEDGNTYAIKVISKLVMGAPGTVSEEELSNEYFLQYISSTQGQNVGDVSAMAQDDRYIFILQDYIDGGSLEDFSINTPALSHSGDTIYKNEQFESIADTMLAANRELSYQGIAHRDYKPDNYMISTSADGNPSVKLIDFGNAVLKDANGVGGSMFGTPGYINKDHLEERPTGFTFKNGIDDQVNNYGQFVTLLETLTGVSCSNSDESVYLDAKDLLTNEEVNIREPRMRQIFTTSYAHNLLFDQLVSAIGADHPYVELLEQVRSGATLSAEDAATYKVAG